MTEQNRPHTLQFRVLSDSDIEKIYQATLECLERTGVNALNAEARELFAKAGAKVDGARVRIPRQVIQKTLKTCPNGFTLWGRDGQTRMDVFPGQVHFGPGLTSSYFIDPYTGERRRSRRQDVALSARVIDALENIDYVMGLALPEDVAPPRASVFEFAEMIINSRKPLMAWGQSLENIEEIYQIAAAAVGGEDALRQKPVFALFAVGLGPLVMPDAIIANAFWAAERGIPVVYHGPGVCGISSPITGAGTLVVELAGCLAGLAAIQLKKPGAPVCLGSVPTPMDPRNARPLYGSPELSLYSAALSEMATYLNLPLMGTAGASESKTVDAQAAIESAAQVIFSLLSRTTIPHDAGFLDCADIGSLEMLVMNDEIIGMARRMMRGIEVSDETLMLDLIDRVGPGGEFITARETAKRFRNEIWLPRLMDRQPWNQWERNGSPTMLDNIRARIRSVLENHVPYPLPDGALGKINAILERQAAFAR
ncbi:MAG: trimethylamine methyltransferase family protein [Chloroflexi bacterium]|nr:trimethylamine methyltransferase family protein [Chloroflexota bacterium]